MQNFVLQSPTTIIFGQDTLAQIGPETSKLGQRVMLVYGQNSLAANGTLEQIRRYLEQEGLSVFEYGGVKSNPTLSHVRQGIKMAKKENIDVIVAAGGGSVIDSAKAISAGALADHDVWQFFRGRKSIKNTIPLACVLTLAAAGSEMNGGMVITNEETSHKFGTGNRLLCPKVSILDPTLTYTVNSAYTAYGAVDAIAHILEFYFTTRDPATPVQDRFMEGLILNIMDSCNRVLADPCDYPARADLMWCTTLALNGWTAAGLGLVGFPMHMIEHSLSAIYDVPHGAGLSVVMPGWLKYKAKEKPAKFAQLGRRLFRLEGQDIGTARQGIDLLENWFKQIKSPTRLEQLDIPASDISNIAENALALAKVWRLKDYDKEHIEKILKLCSQQDQEAKTKN